jgi:hypothetical protein
MQNTRVTTILHLYLSIVVSLLGFSLENESKDEKKNDYKTNEQKHIETLVLLLMAIHMNSSTPKEIMFY